MTTEEMHPQRERPPIGTQNTLALFFSHAFRPFFLAAGIYACLSMAAWLLWIGIHSLQGVPRIITVSEPLHLWHAHEMIFGYGAAAVGGFLLTAIPSWTGASHSRGPALAIMVAIWCLGRMAMWFTALLPPLVAMLADLAFLPMLAVAAGRQLAVQPALRNVIFLSLIAGLVIGNALYHLDRFDLVSNGMQIGLRLGLLTLITMIVVIGGRVIPAFTTNALRRSGHPETAWPKKRPEVDRAALVLTALAALAFVFDAPASVTGVAALLAAAANLLRLAGWKSLATLKEPIVWVLHLGYAWIVFGFGLLGAELLLGFGSTVSALHALGTGGIGTMTLAIMSRASLGHTGRQLVVPKSVIAAYVLVSVAALLRCFGPQLAPHLYNEIMLTAGMTWLVAFVLFSFVFTPILVGPRVRRGA